MLNQQIYCLAVSVIFFLPKLYLHFLNLTLKIIINMSYEQESMDFLFKKNKAWFVFFIITIYSFLGFFIGFVIWEYVLQ